MPIDGDRTNRGRLMCGQSGRRSATLIETLLLQSVDIACQ